MILIEQVKSIYCALLIQNGNRLQYEVEVTVLIKTRHNEQKYLKKYYRFLTAVLVNDERTRSVGEITGEMVCN